MTAVERPILFSGSMVLALLAGRKTQTRRLIQAWEIRASAPCRYGQPGDRLWVRETWARRLDEDHLAAAQLDRRWAWYWADPQTCNTGCAGAAGKRRPAIHMPRWASRLTLEVTEVRAERLTDISEADARAEGVELQPSTVYGQGAHRLEFFRLWESINGKRAPWAGNPWVWAVSFRVVQPTRAAAPDASKTSAGCPPAQP